MVGVQMARHWHIVQNEMGILTFTQYPLMEEKKKRLTISDGLDDGPDYSSDGKYIILILTELDICRYGECNRMGLIRSN
jgi:hypothetical protein